MVVVIFRLTAKDAQAFLQYLAQVLPVTRAYEGCHYVNTLVQPDHSPEVILIQGWATREAQAKYIQWRKQTGDLDQFLSFLTSPPHVEYWDSNAA